MSKFKVGDKVRITCDNLHKGTCGIPISEVREHSEDKSYTVSTVYTGSLETFHYRLKESIWWWAEWLLEKVEVLAEWEI